MELATLQFGHASIAIALSLSLFPYPHVPSSRLLFYVRLRFRALTVAKTDAINISFFARKSKLFYNLEIFRILRLSLT